MESVVGQKKWKVDESVAADMAALAEHMGLCQAALGRWPSASMAMSRALEEAGSRVVTVGSVVIVFVGLASWVASWVI